MRRAAYANGLWLDVGRKEFWIWVSMLLAILYSATEILVFPGVSMATIMVLYFLRKRELRLGNSWQIWGIFLFACFVLWGELFFHFKLGHWKLSLFQTLLVMFFYDISMRSFEEKTRHRLAYETLFLVFYIAAGWVMYEAILENGLQEMPRGYRYLHGWHYVDWSVVMIMLFMMGIKTKMYGLTFAMACVSWVVLPARTYKLYILLFALFALIQQICKIDWHRWMKRKVGGYFRFIVFLLVGSVVFSYLWVFYFMAGRVPNPVHVGIREESNQQRFELSVLTSNHLVNRYIPYSSIPERISGIQWDRVDAAHNTYLLMLYESGIIFSLMYWYLLGGIFDRISTKENFLLLVPYLICGCILHNLFTGWRIFFLLAVLQIPFFSEREIGGK